MDSEVYQVGIRAGKDNIGGKKEDCPWGIGKGSLKKKNRTDINANSTQEHALESIKKKHLGTHDVKQ